MEVNEDDRSTESRCKRTGRESGPGCRRRVRGGPDDYAIGIGGAICQHLSRAGARVAVLDIADANADRTLAPIRAEGGDAMKIIADTAIEADCERAVRRGDCSVTVGSTS